jgi:two-component system, OmpR family, sensor kinase
LGLALVRAIVERHGGQLTIRSRANQGTVVSLRLPRL